MWWHLFTPRFRVRLGVLARSAKGREARVLAAKVSPLLSSFAALVILRLLPGYGYIALAATFVGTLALGAVLAYCVPSPFILLLRVIAADFNKVVLWRKHGGGGRHGS